MIVVILFLLSYVPYQNITSWDVKIVLLKPVRFPGQAKTLTHTKHRTSETGQRRGGDRKREE